MAMIRISSEIGGLLSGVLSLARPPPQISVTRGSYEETNDDEIN